MSIESMMPSSHLILFPSIRVFSNELALRIGWSKYRSFIFSISPSDEYSRWISFRTDWFGTSQNNIWTHFHGTSESESCSVVSDSTVHGILQARILEWVAVPFSRGSSQPRDWTGVFCIAGGFFTNWAIREALSLPLVSTLSLIWESLPSHHSHPMLNHTLPCRYAKC